MDNNKTKKSIWDSKAFWVVVSIMASVLLWVYVTSTEGDLINQTFEGVEIEFKGADSIREKDGLVVTNQSVNTVSVRLRGTRRELSNLSSSNLKAVVDVSNTSLGTHNVSFEIKFPIGVNASNITVVYTNPSTIQFVIDKTNTKTVNLVGKLVGDVAEGYAMEDFEFSPESITVSGPENELNQIANAIVTIKRDDAVDKTIKANSTYEFVDAEGNVLDLKNITCDPETVSVTLPITSTKEVSLTVDIVPGGGATEENVRIECTPSTITIAGDAETLAGINKLSVGTVDLSEFALTFEDTFDVVLDNEISNVTGLSEVKVIVEVIGLETKKFNVTNISTVNLAPGKRVTIITENLEVTLRGSAEVLNKIKSNNIRAVADLSEIGTTTGVFQPEVKISVDGYTGVGAVEKQNNKIYVEIE